MNLAALRRFAPALVCSAVLLSSPAAADDLDALNEELRVETARLEYALEKVQKVNYPVTGDDQRARKNLLKEGRYLMKQAAQVPRDATGQLREVIGLMADKRDDADRFLGNVKPLWAEQTSTRRNQSGYRSAYQEVVKFNDVLLDAESVLERLTAGEVSRVTDLRQHGFDLIAGIKAVRESDHAERDRLVRELIRSREELMALHQAGLSDRQRGYAFVPQSRNRHAWSNVQHSENGFHAMRARFLAPGSAYLTVKNGTDEARHLFVELEFFNAGGDRIGEGVFETASLEELAPGEIREILVPVYTHHPGFWKTARSFTVYLD